MIESRRNQTLKDIRRLRRCKGDEALLEGPHLVGEALAAGLPLGPVLATAAFLATAEGRAIAAALPAPPLLVEPGLLAAAADADSPRGLLAVARLPRGGVEALPVHDGGVYLFVEGLQDPGNLGALARVAEAAGAAGLALAAGTAHANHPRALRASAGSLLRLPVAMAADPAELDRRLGAGGTSPPPLWVALVPRGGTDLFALGGLDRGVLDATLVLVIGAEGPGVSAPLRARATLAVTIPLAPPVESLNATVAAALALFEIRRVRRSGGPKLGPERRQQADRR
jgi:TrmH family RNA methyltransferase